MARISAYKRLGFKIIYKIYFTDGVQKTKYRYYKTKALALKACQDIEKLEYNSREGTVTKEQLIFCLKHKYISPEEGTKILGDKPLNVYYLKDLLLEWEQIPGKSETTRDSENCRITTILKYFENTTLEHIDDNTIEEYKRARYQRVNAGSINKEIAIIRAMLDIAVRKKWIPTNPARDVRYEKVRLNKIRRAFYEDELEKFLNTTQQSTLLRNWAHPVMTTFYYTGMRRSELLRMRKEDIDFQKRRIIIRGNKTESSRTIGLAKKLKTILLNIINKTDDNYVFPHFHPSSLTYAFQRIRKTANLNNELTLHSLRHTYGSYLLERGASLKKTQTLLGHKRIATTERYLHVMPRDDIEEDLL